MGVGVVWVTKRRRNVDTNPTACHSTDVESDISIQALGACVQDRSSAESVHHTQSS